jgi:hypothetical protein
MGLSGPDAKGKRPDAGAVKHCGGAAILLREQTGRWPHPPFKAVGSR